MLLLVNLFQQEQECQDIINVDIKVENELEQEVENELSRPIEEELHEELSTI